MDDMVLGVFDSRESALTRLKRVMDRPTNDEQFKIETHNLRNLKMEEDLDWWKDYDSTQPMSITSVMQDWPITRIHVH